MSTLPEITEALCRAVAMRDLAQARRLSFLAADKMGPPRGDKIRRAFEHEGPEPKLKRWVRVKEPRSPWTPPAVEELIAGWLREAQHAPLLAAHGERVLPLLLVGETRCGKTSSLCGVAAKLDLPVNRLSLAEVVGSHLGESSKAITAAMQEAFGAPRALWLIDEIDAIGQKRTGGQPAAQEQALAMGSLLTELEQLPPSMMVAATSNTVKLLDPALVARFEVVSFPEWAKLTESERASFAASHGHDLAAAAGSYAEAVRDSRRARVARIIESPTGNERGWPVAAEQRSLALEETA